MQEVVRGASVAFALKILGAGLAFGFNVLLARMLGANGAGVYFLALMVVSIATVLGRIGLDNSLVRFIAAHMVKDEWECIKGVYRNSIALALVASIVAYLFLYLSAPLLANVLFSKPELLSPIRWMGLAIIPVVFSNLNGQALRGLKRIAQSQVILSVGVPGLSIVGIVVLVPQMGVMGAIFAYVLAACFAAILGVMWWRSALQHVRHLPAVFSMRTLVESSMPLFWVASFNLVMVWMATFALGMWGTNEEVGIFNVASKTASLIIIFLTAVNSISAPKFSELYHSGDLQALEKIIQQSTRMIGLLAAPAFIIFVSFPDLVMGLFGEQFSKWGIVLSILAVGAFINALTGSVGYVLMMSGHERVVRNNAAFGIFLLIIACIFLVPVFGVVGAAIAVTFSTAIKNIVAVYLVRKWLGLSVFAWQKKVV